MTKIDESLVSLHIPQKKATLRTELPCNMVLYLELLITRNGLSNWQSLMDNVQLAKFNGQCSISNGEFNGYNS